MQTATTNSRNEMNGARLARTRLALRRSKSLIMVFFAEEDWFKTDGIKDQKRKSDGQQKLLHK